MANQLPTSLSRAGVLGAGAVAAANAPVLTAVVLGVGLTLVGILALIGVLARRRTRRDDAYRMLALLLGRPAAPAHEAAGGRQRVRRRRSGR
jgi:hypothetical protein